jgi:dipicolinate synthase subunit A
MIVKQLSVFLENKQGRLCAATDVLAKNGINISALSLADTAEFGILRLIVDRPDEARRVLMEEGIVVRVSDVIAVAMNELPVTIDGIHAAIIGYGRIGSLLAERLRALGAEVTVYARRSEQCTLARLHHHRAARLLCREGETVLESIPADLRVIFNTVPSRILAGRVLEMLPPECLLIDLASAPGGIDHAAARAMGLHTVWATALPGKCAPESAGRILAEVLHEILSERMITPTLYGKDG